VPAIRHIKVGQRLVAFVFVLVTGQAVINVVRLTADELCDLTITTP